MPMKGDFFRIATIPTFKSNLLVWFLIVYPFRKRVTNKKH